MMYLEHVVGLLRLSFAATFGGLCRSEAIFVLKQKVLVSLAEPQHDANDFDPDCKISDLQLVSLSRSDVFQTPISRIFFVFKMPIWSATRG